MPYLMIQQYILSFDPSTNPATHPIAAIGHTINAHPLSNPAEDHPRRRRTNLVVTESSPMPSH